MMNKNIIYFILLSGLSICIYFYASQQNCTVQKINQESSPKRRKFIQNKLWRDYAAIKLEEQDGAIIHRITLDDAEYGHQLSLKLKEEADEVHVAKNKDEIINEIGDVLEIIDCMIKFHEIDINDITAARDKKRADRGSYVDRQFVIMSEYLPGSFGEWYSLQDPSKYIEILD